MSDFVSTYPSRVELMRMSPYEGSKRVIQAFKEAREELQRRGVARPTQEQVAKLLGEHVSTSTLHMSTSHVRAVEHFGMSPMLAKQAAVRRLRAIEPVTGRMPADLEAAEDSRSDVEIATIAVSNLLIRSTETLKRFDAAALATHLRAEPARRGATLSALIDLKQWLGGLEEALRGQIK